MKELSIEEALGTLTPVFWWNFNSTKPLVVNSGGTSSSKTISILQNLLFIATTQKEKEITIVGQDLPNMKVGPIRDIANLIKNSQFLQAEVAKYSQTTHQYTFKSGSIIEFRAAATAQDAKSGKRDYLFINEANGISFEVADEFIVRTRERVFIDFNPTARFWAHVEYENNPDVDWFISNYLHNQYLGEKTISKILAYKDKSPYKWRVYGLGLLGILEGHIFQSFQMIDKIPDDIYYVYGLDFGYSQDPTALVKVGIRGQSMYIKLLLYEPGLKDAMIGEWMEYFGITTELIIADKQGQQTIDYLAEHYRFNIEPCEKGPHSVLRGLNLMNDYDIFIERGSEPVHDEMSEYLWQAGGKPPAKKNHAIDAARYATNVLILPEVEDFEENVAAI